MKFKKRNVSKEHQLFELFNVYTQATSDDVTSEQDNAIEFFIQLVDIFRIKDVYSENQINIQSLIDLIEKHDAYKKLLTDYLQIALYKKDFDSIITDTGIIKDTDFFYELKKRLIDKVIPYQAPKNTLQYVLNQVFYLSTDPIWLQKIPLEQIINAYNALKIKDIYQEEKNNFEISEILYASEVLAHRISGKAMETHVNKMVPEYQNFDSPFIAFSRELSELTIKLKNSNTPYIQSDDLNYKQVLILHKQCENYIDSAFNNSHKFGISLKVNQSLLLIRQQLQRLKEMLPYIVLDHDISPKTKTIQFCIQLIKYNCGKTNVKKLIADSTQSLSYEITQHTAKTGEKYITNGKREYYNMFWAACGGGLIVGFLCIFKLLLGKAITSDFGHAFLYSMNYSLGFIAIYLCHYTLATKQPAMTASALANALAINNQSSKKDIGSKYLEFAQFFARVFRSQFIAFVGNVIMAFPIALLLIWSIYQIWDINIADAKWGTLINDLNPITSPSIFHAAIAGVFLFISGIIAGSIANRDKYDHVYYRIQEHPILKKTFGKKKTKKIASIYEKKWAGIISNFWFGIFLGSTYSIGIFFGLDIDIRHITFASGNLALGMFGADFNITTHMLVWSIIGIGIIGLINFLVSFSLSLGVALRSRNIPFSELRLIAISVWHYFRKYPLQFFFPPKQKNNNM